MNFSPHDLVLIILREWETAISSLDKEAAQWPSKILAIFHVISDKITDSDLLWLKCLRERNSLIRKILSLKVKEDTVFSSCEDLKLSSTNRKDSRFYAICSFLGYSREPKIYVRSQRISTHSDKDQANLSSPWDLVNDVGFLKASGEL